MVHRELTVCVRQADDLRYANMLARMRVGKLTNRDIEMLKTRVTKWGKDVSSFPWDERLTPREMKEKAQVDAKKKRSADPDPPAPVRKRKAPRKKETQALQAKEEDSNDADQESQEKGEDRTVPDKKKECGAARTRLPAEDVFIPDEHKSISPTDLMLLPVYLFSKHSKVDATNTAYCSLLPHSNLPQDGTIKPEYRAIDVFMKKKKNGDLVAMEDNKIVQFLRNESNKNALEKWDHVIPKVVQIRQGCQYLVTRNISTEKGVVNGLRCKFIDGEFWAPDRPGSLQWRTISGLTTPVSKCRRLAGNVYLKRTQVPLRLGYAVTIHASQGMTLDSAFVDLEGTFIPGQGYVACSRVRTLDGLHIVRFDTAAFVASERAAEFYLQMKSMQA